MKTFRPISLILFPVRSLKHEYRNNKLTESIKLNQSINRIIIINKDRKTRVQRIKVNTAKRSVLRAIKTSLY